MMILESELSINHPDNPRNPLYMELQWIHNPRVREMSIAERRKTQLLELEVDRLKAEIKRLGGNPDFDNLILDCEPTPTTPPPAGENDGQWAEWFGRYGQESSAIVNYHAKTMFGR